MSEVSDSDQHVLLSNKEEEEEVLQFPALSNESIREAVRLWRHIKLRPLRSITTLTSGTPAKSLT